MKEHFLFGFEGQFQILLMGFNPQWFLATFFLFDMAIEEMMACGCCRDREDYLVVLLLLFVNHLCPGN